MKKKIGFYLISISSNSLINYIGEPTLSTNKVTINMYDVVIMKVGEKIGKGNDFLTRESAMHFTYSSFNIAGFISERNIVIYEEEHVLQVYMYFLRGNDLVARLFFFDEQTDTAKELYTLMECKVPLKVVMSGINSKADFFNKPFALKLSLIEEDKVISTEVLMKEYKEHLLQMTEEFFKDYNTKAIMIEEIGRIIGDVSISLGVKLLYGSMDELYNNVYFENRANNTHALYDIKHYTTLGMVEKINNILSGKG